MLEAVHPELFMPVHGEYQHLVMHGRLAEECGVKPENILRIEDGQPLTVLPDSFTLGAPVAVDYTIVDGKGVGDVGATVLRERRILGDEGIVIVSMVLDDESGSILQGPEIISRGFVFEQQLSYVLEDAKCIVLDEVEETVNPGKLRENIRISLRRFFRRVLERDPIVMPVINVV